MGSSEQRTGSTVHTVTEAVVTRGNAFFRHPPLCRSSEDPRTKAEQVHGYAMGIE